MKNTKEKETFPTWPKCTKKNPAFAAKTNAANPVVIDTYCLTCRYAYFADTEAYEAKADLFEPESNAAFKS